MAELAERGPWDHLLVIPARREAIRCLEALARPPGRTLCVLVVNAGDDPVDRAQGRALSTAVAGASDPGEPTLVCAELGLELYRSGDDARSSLPGDILLVDRWSPEHHFGPEGGVGLARKLGADLGVALEAHSALRSGWIHTTDADAILPACHFERAEALAHASAAVAPFWHVPGGDPATDTATSHYELSLRYYVAGLRWAGSPYAFHTIGSLISVRSSAYVGVRGFPKRRAGEDFYLLNKLAKLGPIVRPEGPPVEIRARRSTRAPFGTGPAVEALLGGDTLEVYDSRVFEVLRRCLLALSEVADGGRLDTLEALTQEFSEVPELARCLAHARVQSGRLGHVPAQLERALREHFDGFRTLKLIHDLTRARWPKQSWVRAFEAAPFVDWSLGAPLDEQRRALARLEDVPES